ncbi:MAG: 6-carboxytetrahydropterin synthase [Phycisphaerales bacterium]|nr:6-carboxytetrahydropterin synthase [Phycisphaerales bacterium]
MPRYQLTLRSEFSAAHQLTLLDGSLEPLHGHNWPVEVVVEGEELDGMGVLADFTILQPKLRAITDELHDTFLNDVPVLQPDNPTTERVARHIAETFAPVLPAGVRLVSVRVWETRDCAATFLP